MKPQNLKKQQHGKAELPPLTPERPRNGARHAPHNYREATGHTLFQHTPIQTKKGSALSQARRKNFSEVVRHKHRKYSDGLSPLLGDPNAQHEKSISYGSAGKNRSLHSIPMLQLHHRNLSGSDGSGGDHNNMSANSSTSCDYRGEDMEEFADKAPSPFELLQLLKPLVVSENNQFDPIARSATNSILAFAVGAGNPHSIPQSQFQAQPPSRTDSRATYSRSASALIRDTPEITTFAPYPSPPIFKPQFFQRSQEHLRSITEGNLLLELAPLDNQDRGLPHMKTCSLSTQLPQDYTLTPIYEHKPGQNFTSQSEQRKSSLSLAAQAARRNRHRESAEQYEEQSSLKEMVTQVDQEEEDKEQMNGISGQERLCRQHLIHTYHAVQFSKQLPPPDPEVLQKKKVKLPDLPRANMKTIVFDLDETLIHYMQSAVGDPVALKEVDKVLEVKFPTGETAQAPINVRPFAIECLRAISRRNEVVVFTASHQCYADVILDYLDPEHKLINHRFYRQHCLVTPDGIHVKNLEVIGNRELKNVLIIDNAVYSFGYHLDNGVPMVPFYDNRGDRELVLLMQYVESLEDVEDVRDHNRASFSLETFDEEKLKERLHEGAGKGAGENEQNVTPNRPTTKNEAATGDSGQKEKRVVGSTGEGPEEDLGLWKAAC